MQREGKADLRGRDSEVIAKYRPQHPSCEGKVLSIRLETEARHAFPFLGREKIHEPVRMATTSATVGVPEVHIAIVEGLDGESLLPWEIKIEQPQILIGNAGGVWHHGKTGSNAGNTHEAPTTSASSLLVPGSVPGTGECNCCKLRDKAAASSRTYGSRSSNRWRPFGMISVWTVEEVRFPQPSNGSGW